MSRPLESIISEFWVQGLWLQTIDVGKVSESKRQGSSGARPWRSAKAHPESRAVVNEQREGRKIFRQKSHMMESHPFQRMNWVAVG